MCGLNSACVLHSDHTLVCWGEPSGNGSATGEPIGDDEPVLSETGALASNSGIPLPMIPPSYAVAGDGYRFEIPPAYDGDVLRIADAELPNWLELEIDATGFSGTPHLSDVGAHNISFGVTDGLHSETVEQTIVVSAAPEVKRVASGSEHTCVVRGGREVVC